MAKRKFDEIAVVATGSQHSADRFGIERQFNFDVPPISLWRCNLTGLSQLQNLYFVAYGQNIYVYIPHFPTQIIAEQPSLIFTSQPSSPGLTGYLDQRNPHAINNLAVELFGTEEVLAVVRDDGDVDAFLIRHIAQAIERRREPGSTIGVEGHEIRPFFQSNVGISAWGLAIHSEARILATSSNAHEVRIFKFGLLKPANEHSPLDKYVAHSHDATDGSERSQTDDERETDVTHHVLNGETNIPYISFCNTGDDPEARWLLTTDISGVCRVMDLHSLEPVQAFRFGRSFATPHAGGFDRLNAGWAIMFLDRRSFKVEHDGAFALGVDENVEKTLPKVHRNGEVWDLSNTTRKLEEYAEPFMLHPAQTHRRVEPTTTLRSSSNVGFANLASRDINVDSADDHMQDADSDGDGAADVDIEIDIQAESQDEDESGGVEVEITESSAHRDDEDMEYHTAEEADSDELDETISQSPSLSDAEHEERIGQLIDDDDDPDDEGTEDTVSYASFYSGESIVGNDARFVHSLTPLCNNLPCPILHASVRNVYLLQPPTQKQPPQHRDDINSTAAFHPPMLGLANPLKQPIHQAFAYLRIYERLNMSASIPSLGIVVLASQKGRALILSLTRVTPSTKFPQSLNDFRCEDKSVYGMKVEGILPFAEQERQNERASYPLHGIAVGPVQGSEGKKSGRWRLMMMYQDHSILSYELSRRSSARDSGVDIGDVVV